MQGPGSEEKGVSPRFFAYLRQRFEVEEFTLWTDNEQAKNRGEGQTGLPIGMPHNLDKRVDEEEGFSAGRAWQAHGHDLPKQCLGSACQFYACHHDGQV